MTGYDDITDRLRAKALGPVSPDEQWPILAEAADAIAALRAALQEARSETERNVAERNAFAREMRPGIETLQAEVERLRAALADAAELLEAHWAGAKHVDRFRAAAAGSPSPQPPTECAHSWNYNAQMCVRCGAYMPGAAQPTEETP